MTTAKLTVTGYTFKPGAHFAAKLAPSVGKRLAEMTEAKGDHIVAADVVDDARAPTSPLHALFEWEDSRAASEYRLEQARRLLRSIQIEWIDRGGSSGESRAYVVVTEAEEQHYVPMVRVLRSQHLRDQVLAAAERDLDAFQRKYSGMKELFGVIVAVKQFLAKRRKQPSLVKSR